MEKVSLQLWCAYPNDLLDQETEHACLQVLSAEELARWRGYKFDRSKREYLATHALARAALSQRLGALPASLCFQTDSFGKPSLDPESELQFNLSNSAELVVCLVAANRALGVDVEPFARAQSVLEVAPRMFSPLELVQLKSLPIHQQLRRSLQLWTLKEAYIKARGMGFRLPLQSFSFIFEEPESIQLQLEPILNDDAPRWSFCLVEHAEHCIAMMVESLSTPHLHTLEARPPLASPRPIDTLSSGWYPRP